VTGPSFFDPVAGNDGVGKTLYTAAVNDGLWQIICHVQKHLTLGMVANYRIYPEGDCPLPPLVPAQLMRRDEGLFS